MANVTSIQKLVDSERNLVIKLTGSLDTSNQATTTLVDVSALVDVNTTALNPQKPTSVAIKKVTYDVADGLTVNLFWDATTDEPIWSYYGRGCVDSTKYGFIQNNAGAGKTGDIVYNTTGYSSGTVTFSLVIEMIKQWS